MKFNVLVAAAMVITRVNAAGKGGFGGLLKKGGGMTGSESSWNLLDKDPESGPSQDAAGDELRPRPSKSPRRKPGASQGRDHTKKKPSDNLEAETPLACNSMASELKDLQKKILGLANSYSNQQLLFDDLAKKMVHWRTTQNGDTSKEYGNDGAKQRLADFLQVAAMVITSVNAGGDEGFEGQLPRFKPRKKDPVVILSSKNCPFHGASLVIWIMGLETGAILLRPNDGKWQQVEGKKMG
ncbi:hypothetical protein BASA62_003670 [Batrachochytrium salamandrivorans]|nr:hypothetical protein BASA62_003670 [Batrachochytrium salamandrivorans]